VVTEAAVVEHNPDPLAMRGRLSARQRRWVPVASVGVIVAACLGIAAWVANNEAQVNAAFDRAHLSFGTTTHHRRLALANLARVRADLDAVNRQVGLDTTTLSQDTTRLQGVETALANARSNVSSQTSTKSALQVCLAGVEQALNALSVNDQSHAITALDAVSSSCTVAVAANG
jgi:hypothetical protein